MQQLRFERCIDAVHKQITIDFESSRNFGLVKSCNYIESIRFDVWFSDLKISESVEITEKNNWLKLSLNNFELNSNTMHTMIFFNMRMCLNMNVLKPSTSNQQQTVNAYERFAPQKGTSCVQRSTKSCAQRQEAIEKSEAYENQTSAATRDVKRRRRWRGKKTSTGVQNLLSSFLRSVDCRTVIYFSSFGFIQRLSYKRFYTITASKHILLGVYDVCVFVFE